MKRNDNRKMSHLTPQAMLSLALALYNFATPEIRVLMRQTLGHAVSGRTIKRLIRSTGPKMKRGRPLSTPRIHKCDVNHLIELTSTGAESFKGNTLQLFQQVDAQFDLTPRQYLQWVAKSIRRGKCMMRRCLLCDEYFASMHSGERHCRSCQGDRRRLVNEERRTSFA